MVAESTVVCGQVEQREGGEMLQRPVLYTPCSGSAPHKLALHLRTSVAAHAPPQHPPPPGAPARPPWFPDTARLQARAQGLVHTQLVASRGGCGCDQPPALGLLPSGHPASFSPAAPLPQHPAAGCPPAAAPVLIDWLSQGSGCHHYPILHPSS